MSDIAIHNEATETGTSIGRAVLPPVLPPPNIYYSKRHAPALDPSAASIGGMNLNAVEVARDNVHPPTDFNTPLMKAIKMRTNKLADVSDDNVKAVFAAMEKKLIDIGLQFKDVQAMTDLEEAIKLYEGTNVRNAKAVTKRIARSLMERAEHVHTRYITKDPASVEIGTNMLLTSVKNRLSQSFLVGLRGIFVNSPIIDVGGTVDHGKMIFVAKDQIMSYANAVPFMFVYVLAMSSHDSSYDDMLIPFKHAMKVWDSMKKMAARVIIEESKIAKFTNKFTVVSGLGSVSYALGGPLDSEKDFVARAKEHASLMLTEFSEQLESTYGALRDQSENDTYATVAQLMAVTAADIDPDDEGVPADSSDEDEDV